MYVIFIFEHFEMSLRKRTHFWRTLGESSLRRGSVADFNATSAVDTLFGWSSLIDDCSGKIPLPSAVANELINYWKMLPFLDWYHELTSWYWWTRCWRRHNASRDGSSIRSEWNWRLSDTYNKINEILKFNSIRSIRTLFSWPHTHAA